MLSRVLSPVFVLALIGLGLSATPASAAPDQSGSVLIFEPNGFPPICNQPCFVAAKAFAVFLDGNPTGPGLCPAGNQTYLYTLSHVGGSGPFVPALIEFEVEVANSALNVTSAGFIPGLLDPSATIIGNDVVTWDFLAPTIASGQTTSQLFICSPLLPGTVSDNTISVDGQASLDAPGTCVGPFEVPEPPCLLSIDKTCCLPSPASPGVDICEGKVLRAVFEVVGGDCSATTNDQQGKAKCSGPDPVVGPLDTVDIVVTKNASKIAVNGTIGGTTDVPVGSTIEFTNEVDTNGELKASTKFNVVGPGGTQSLTIHTSCSKSLGCDDQFGSVRLVELESTEGGTTVCSQPEEGGTQCVPTPSGSGTCDSKIAEIVFEWTGDACQDPLPNPQSGKAKCDGNIAGAEPVNVIYTGKDPGKFTVSPASDIDIGESFAVTATGTNNLKASTKLLVTDASGTVQSLKIHTSCSKPISCGDVFGGLKVLQISETDGDVCDTSPPGPLFQNACEVPLAPPTPHCTSKVQELHLAYIGDEFGLGCSVTNSQDGKASCTGVDDPGEPVSVTITKDAGLVEADPNAGIVFPDVVVISTNSGSKLKASTKFDVTGSLGTQSIEIHTSCSKSLNLGDVFGSFAVVGIERENDGFVGLGGQVEYQYKVTNNSSEDAIVTVTDDVLGPIASGETVAGNGGMETFFTTKTLLATLTNKATVTGTTTPSGVMCNAPMDEVTVTVSLPPQGSFDCKDAKPLDALSMEWAGLQDICVIAYDGDAGGTQLLLQDDVAPGDLVIVSGMGGSPNDQEWEVFAAGDCGGTLLGTSQFHISCSDSDMNGVEDCGKNEGDGKSNDPLLLNDWLLEGMDGDETLDCTPDPITLPGPSFCGLGYEVALILPALMWLGTRRRRRARGLA